MFIHGTSFIRALMRNVPITLANDEWEKKNSNYNGKTFVHGIYSVSRQFGVSN